MYLVQVGSKETGSQVDLDNPEIKKAQNVGDIAKLNIFGHLEGDERKQHEQVLFEAKSAYKPADKPKPTVTASVVTMTQSPVAKPAPAPAPESAGTGAHELAEKEKDK